jgi:hypothetical protein
MCKFVLFLGLATGLILNLYIILSLAGLGRIASGEECLTVKETPVKCAIFLGREMQRRMCHSVGRNLGELEYSFIWICTLGAR